jgi:hypothetical protein
MLAGNGKTTQASHLARNLREESRRRFHRNGAEIQSASDRNDHESHQVLNPTKLAFEGALHNNGFSTLGIQEGASNAH